MKIISGKNRKIWLLAVIMMFTFGLAFGVHAAPRVAKVEKKTTYSSGREYCTIVGLTSKDKKVWSYRCSSAPAAQGSHVAFCSNSKYVFVIDGSNFICLIKATGAVKNKAKNAVKGVGSCVAIYADSYNTVYMAGYFTHVVRRYTRTGRLMWKRTLDNKSLWPHKMTLSGDNLTIYFEGNYSGYHKSVILNKKNGKVKKYIN